MELVEIISLIFVGLVSGVLGGLLGIGGSIIMIPILTIVFRENMHLSEAAAMIVNVFVAVPSSIQHYRAGAVDVRAATQILPFTIVAIIIGVLVGNAVDGRILEAIFGVFLIYVVAANLLRMFSRAREEEDAADSCTSWTRLGIIGTLVGVASGLLGIGGGTLTVPLLQRACRMPLRQCIATSAAVMVLMSAVGAIWKNATLHTLEADLYVVDSLLIAACLAPTAFLGSSIGAKLTHVLPVNVVRVIFVILLAVAGVRMLMSAAAPHDEPVEASTDVDRSTFGADSSSVDAHQYG